MQDIDLAASTWLGIGIEAAETGDRARALSALTAISGKDWESIRDRVGDDLFAVFTAPLSSLASPEDFDRHADQALALVTPSSPPRSLPDDRGPQ